MIPILIGLVSFLFLNELNDYFIDYVYLISNPNYSIKEIPNFLSNDE